MRLTDVDELLKYIPAEEPLSRWALKNAPTVEAIPIEWIKNYLAKAPTHYVFVNDLLEDWEKDNGKE